MSDDLPPKIAPNSAQIGFVQPIQDTEPTAGQSLDSFLQQVIASIVGIRFDLVRPRWQQEPPNLPAIGTNWAAIGVTDSRPLGFPVLTEVTVPGAQNAQQIQSDQEEFDCLCSFYGPQADNLAVKLRSGLMIAQNREALQLASIGLINTTGRKRIPTLTQQRFLMRVDMTVTFRRLVQTTYPILYFLSSPVSLTTDTGLTEDFSAQ